MPMETRVAASKLPEWLSGYAARIYDWQERHTGGRRTFTRRLGIVEGLFDTDGVEFEGRADLCTELHIEIRTTLDEQATREHIANAWSVLRQEHPLLSATAISLAHDDPLSGGEHERAFVFEQAATEAELRQWGQQHLDFVADHYSHVQAEDFYDHLMNSSRVVDATKALSRVFVLPYNHSSGSSFPVTLMFVLAHQITDGLTTFRWMSAFIDLLNLSHTELKSRMASLCTTPAMARLPPPQEALYHPIKGSVARQRWFWAITRVLRHVKHTNPAAFQNPLRRPSPALPTSSYPPKYDKLLDYSRVPPLRHHAIRPVIGPKSTARLAALCRQSHISFGAGLFTLVAIVMMQFHESLYPAIPLSQRLPFIGSFPINPRPFLAGTPTTGQEDSLMLAFSEGVVLPFLPHTLPFEGRFRLLGKQAHRQLRQYQKRKRTAAEELSLGSSSPTQLLPALYLATLERLSFRSLSRPKPRHDPQGALPAATPPSLGTCGISSVGDRTPLISSGKYDVSTTPPSNTGRHFLAADFRDIQSAVRARDGEFLCGVASDRSQHTYLMISVDGSAIDMGRAREFKRVIERILEVEGCDGGDGEGKQRKRDAGKQGGDGSGSGSRSTARAKI
ncbi:uncharacterized protein HMPREF1541_03099 [Cyphellophora europaea CBS 101466]|uniref:Condensation domain-containing protein n=1 Tax=Cyphellophora europaea (strain CBS 101466) TaxID=1220924 RepID=W2RZP4_CYPE1|nr:uncharacterized protein HMPREF1541_03099 [Cyphellophora europaea CBS 101466]ETN41164.1 hypothetical protein HMPREF1541_03099 [Cyphellophora europaea CBS 101466]